MELLISSVSGCVPPFHIILFILMLSGTQSALLCSQCTSEPGGACMTSAPPATECQHSKNRLVNCMTTRKYDYNDTLIQFSRGCTMVRVGEGCMEQNDNTTLCYKACHQDNCNHSKTLGFNSVLLFITLALQFIILDKFDLIS